MYNDRRTRERTRLKQHWVDDFNAMIDDVSYNICIEYDGRQHFGIQNTWYEGHENEYYEQKERDAIKTQYCIDHEIVLYRISYLEYDNIDNRMEEILKELTNGQV